jgi:hypothetical protein
VYTLDLLLPIIDFGQQSTFHPRGIIHNKPKPLPAPVKIPGGEPLSRCPRPLLQETDVRDGRSTTKHSRPSMPIVQCVLPG